MFTEHGAIMAATVLNSPRAVQMSVYVVRAFVKLRADERGRARVDVASQPADADVNEMIVRTVRSAGNAF